jgi:hypothetical protein
VQTAGHVVEESVQQLHEELLEIRVGSFAELAVLDVLESQV